MTTDCHNWPCRLLLSKVKDAYSVVLIPADKEEDLLLKALVMIVSNQVLQFIVDILVAQHQVSGH